MYHYPDLEDHGSASDDYSATETLAREKLGLPTRPMPDLERRVDHLENQVRELIKHIAFLFAEYHKEQP